MMRKVNRNRDINLRRGVMFLAALLYVAACVAPAIDFGPQSGDPSGASLHGVAKGFTALIGGWVSLLGLHLAWLANPLLFFGWILLGVSKSPYAVTAGLLALALGAWYLGFSTSYGRPLLGAYLWVGSMVVFALGALFISFYTGEWDG
jgi:hypothetical protein